MWNDTVTLYIDDSSIRLLVAKGQRVKKWADLKLEPGLVKGAVVVQEAEVAAKITQLLKGQDVRTKKVILGYSGMHSLTRPAALPHLPKAMVAEAVAREARRVLPVPLDQLYLTWRILPSPKGKIQVFMVTTPRKAADSLVETLHQAGLEPSRMAIKPLILTKCLPESTAILVDVQPTEFDIVLMNNGIPQPVRTMAFPNQEITWEEKLKMIAGDMSRTIQFFDTNNPENPLDAKVPVFVSGEMNEKTELQSDLSTVIGHPVKILPPTLKGPDQMETTRYMVNIAMATNISTLNRDNAFPISNLNVLPAPYHPKPMSMTKVIGIPGGVAVAGVVVPMLMLMQNTSTNIESMQSQLNITNEMILQKNTQKAALKKEVADLESKAAGLKLSYENLKLANDFIDTHQEQVNGDLQITLSKLVPNINLTGISEVDGLMTIQGSAPNRQNVYAYAQVILNYARQLDLSERFVETTISSLKVESESDSTQSAPIEFTLTFKREK